MQYGSRYAIFSVCLLALLAGIFWWGVRVGEGRIPAAQKVLGLVHKEGDPLFMSSSTVDFMPYWRVWNTLERKFSPFSTSTPEIVSAEDRVYRSIEGLVASYNDPYTVFMRPQLTKDFKIATRGSLEGIGAVVGEREGALIVVAPVPGSPAERAGLVSGDYIRKIDGTDTAGVDVQAAVDKIRGQGGTTVTLTVESEGKEPREVAIVRGTIEIPSTTHMAFERDVPVVAVRDKNGQVSSTSEPVETEKRDFYIVRLFSFSESSVSAFERELRAFSASSTGTLIIDLRGNPGGYLEAAVNMAGWFLPQGSVVVRDFTGPEKTERVYTTTARTLFPEGKVPKIALLVDKGTASAAEILAGALHEYHVAELIGTRTFGKGSVQELVNITDALALKVTVSRWYTPNGVSISHGGLTPDIEVDPTKATSSDPWIDAAVGYFAGL